MLITYYTSFMIKMFKTCPKCQRTKLFSNFQEAIVKILKMRKRVSLAQLQTELIELLKNMFLPSKKLVKETIEWLIENKYMERDEANINTFVYST
ncbi:Cullin [Brachionus plicatilis]|uniref:Cullin n=1 Tax=Brachionus plicatilis TaxID=10195 RepID=A0A3M7S1V0_BRAPC|nr:Cullin [Brachionus plicatilis]